MFLWIFCRYSSCRTMSECSCGFSIYSSCRTMSECSCSFYKRYSSCRTLSECSCGFLVITVHVEQWVNVLVVFFYRFSSCRAISECSCGFSVDKQWVSADFWHIKTISFTDMFTGDTVMYTSHSRWFLYAPPLYSFVFWYSYIDLATLIQLPRCSLDRVCFKKAQLVNLLVHIEKLYFHFCCHVIIRCVSTWVYCFYVFIWCIFVFTRIIYCWHSGSSCLSDLGIHKGSKVHRHHTLASVWFVKFWVLDTHTAMA